MLAKSFKVGDSLKDETQVYFYQQNLEVLKFHVLKDIDKIKFNHYIMQKENLQRLKGDLPRGYFYMMVNVASQDLEINRNKLIRIIEEFERLNILKVVEKPPKGSKGTSTWLYLSAKNVEKSEHEVEHDNEHEVEHEKANNINALEKISEHEAEHDNEHEVEHTKKELLKRVSKKKDIYIHIPDVENVKLTQEQYDKLVAEHGKEYIDNKILDLDNYIVNGKGSRYKDHNKVLRSWIRNDKKQNKKEESYDPLYF